MGEAVISDRTWMEQSENKKNVDKCLTGGVRPGSPASTASSVVIWERFLPKMVVRVLLVEADDSTRQIIAALLRKCSYKVAAVSDGLKAWEILRERPCNIDLILTEVDLPLISGYALLSLVMEHEVCKNIPVIMMSSHDSVTTVYKCMLKGATDFLVKPVRKNELSNLWQHVWRKQASNNASGLGPPDDIIGQKKDEATAENNVSSDNISSRCMACARRSRECTEKGSEAQSSCTKPESGNDVDEVVQLESAEPRSSKSISECRSQGGKNFPNDETLRDSSLEAIDLIKSIDNHRNVASGSSDSNICPKKFDDVHELDLSLQRPILNHSEASPFSRYINKSVNLITNQLKTVPERREFNQYMACSFDTIDLTMESVQTRNGEMAHPVAVRGARHEYIGGTQSQVQSVLDSGSIDDDIDNKQRKESESLGNENFVSHGNNAATVTTAPYEHVQDGLLNRTMQREAALNKFRLKRKDRCFDKKVRYESRKKLAEQRPRVKGQFVRQPINSSAAG